MKTTLDLPDELMRDIKVRAAQENRTIKDLVTELLNRALYGVPTNEPLIVSLPLLECRPGTLTPDEVHETLLEADVESLIL